MPAGATPPRPPQSLPVPRSRRSVPHRPTVRASPPRGRSRASVLSHERPPGLRPGALGYDFGTEARRDSFKQLMPPVTIGDTRSLPNPYDARQMVDYLAADLSEAQVPDLDLNLELTPIYAIEPVGPFGREVYDVLRRAAHGRDRGRAHAEKFIDRVSLPARSHGPHGPALLRPDRAGGRARQLTLGHLRLAD